MKVSIRIEYDVERTSESETVEQQEQLEQLVEEELRGYVESIRRRSTAEGLQVDVSSS